MREFGGEQDRGGREDDCIEGGGDGEVLRRGHHAQEEAAGEAEEGQGQNERIRARLDPAGSFHRRASDG